MLLKTADSLDARAATTFRAPRVLCDRRGRWLQVFDPTGFEWNRVELPVPGLPARFRGLRILHVSDLHLRGKWFSAYDQFIERANANPPDLVVFTGDFVESKHDHRPALPIAQRLVTQLRSRLGAVAILGNHDGDLLAPWLARWNVELLDGRRLRLSDGESTLELIGMEGPVRGDLSDDWIESIPQRMPNSLRIVLSHYPDAIMRARPLWADIQLSGHTHGGQVCLPGRIPIITHDKLPRHMCSGIFRVNDTWLVINRGLGFASLQFRAFCPGEVIELKLVPA